MNGVVRALVALLPGLGLVPAAGAQTDYYNTDANRPLRIEDAYPTERYAFELQLAPVRLARTADGLYAWEVAPELAYGILARVQLELALPIRAVDLPGPDDESGPAGLHVSALYNLNVETGLLPAFAIATEVLLPVGELAPEETYTSVRGILTRTFRVARAHLNGAYTFGDEPGPDAEPLAHDELSRWWAGLALDRAFPLRSLLVMAEVHAEQPLDAEADLLWSGAAGLRWQWSPRLAVDAGIGRTFTDGDESTFLTLGAAYMFALRPLIPLP